MLNPSGDDVIQPSQLERPVRTLLLLPIYRLPRSFGLAWLYDSEERYHSTTWVSSCQEKNGYLQRYWRWALPPRTSLETFLAEKNGFVNLDNVLENLPSIGEQTVDSITENTILINNQCPNPRMKFVMERLVHHLHGFAKEVNLQTDEWLAAIRFLTETGQKCSDVRQEFILLSDILGLSSLVDGLSNSKPTGCTESTVLGPFHTDDAPETEHGGNIASKTAGKKLVIEGAVKDKNGVGIPGAQLDVWEADEDGFYDVQNADRKGPDNRGIITTDGSGKYRFEAILPTLLPPGHIHFMIKAKDYESLTTALYIKGDPFIDSDAVFGVKNSLIVDPLENSPDDSHPSRWWSLKYDFVFQRSKTLAITRLLEEMKF
ncbi:hypothetical protein KEM48_003625 [Puccinia striiformis f. sp. tritici PST-130]|nr:hypothetical protein KEM48_003625 [Puccinia striiformis f. sp. tritici PST-130]